MITSYSINSPRRIPPIVAFFGTFSLVMTILFLTTDLKANKHRRKNVPLKRDSDLTSVKQDNPQLIDFIRQNFLNSPGIQPDSNTRLLNPTMSTKDSATMTANSNSLNLATLFQNKTNGVFIEVGASEDNDSGTEFLEHVLNWSGLLIQPDPVIYNNLQLQKRSRSYSANTCVSPTQYPREVSFKNSLEEGKISPGFEYKRVYCFPLYSLLLAYNATKIDLMCINAHGFEFQSKHKYHNATDCKVLRLIGNQVLRTLPWQKVNITAFSIACSKHDSSISKKLFHFLDSHSYKHMTDFSNASYQVFLKISN